MSDNPTDETLEQLHLRYQITAMVAKKYVKKGFIVVVQDNYLGDELTRFIRMLEPYKPQIIVLNSNIEAVEKRETQRGKTGYVVFFAKSLLIRAFKNRQYCVMSQDIHNKQNAHKLVTQQVCGRFQYQIALCIVKYSLFSLC